MGLFLFVQMLNSWPNFLTETLAVIRRQTRHYSSVASCRTKIPAICKFRGISKFVLIYSTISRLNPTMFCGTLVVNHRTGAWGCASGHSPVYRLTLRIRQRDFCWLAERLTGSQEDLCSMKSDDVLNFWRQNNHCSLLLASW